MNGWGYPFYIRIIEIARRAAQQLPDLLQCLAQNQLLNSQIYPFYVLGYHITLPLRYEQYMIQINSLTNQLCNPTTYVTKYTSKPANNKQIIITLNETQSRKTMHHHIQLWGHPNLFLTVSPDTTEIDTN